ncbi:MAG: hypothetical protein ACK5UE_10225 [Chitinophagales bacterium]|jgi:hypothetical protein|nr:hypothetical protein [Sphingobacteriales bacterium]
MSGYNARMMSAQRKSTSEYAYLTGAQANMINTIDYLTEEIRKKNSDN